MTHVGKIDILTGHEIISNMHFNLKIIFIAYSAKKHAISQNLYS